MNIILVLEPNQRCQGCGRCGYVDRKSLLCVFCVNREIDSGAWMKRRLMWPATEQKAQHFLSVVAQAKKEGLLK